MPSYSKNMTPEDLMGPPDLNTGKSAVLRALLNSIFEGGTVDDPDGKMKAAYEGAFGPPGEKPPESPKAPGSSPNRDHLLKQQPDPETPPPQQSAPYRDNEGKSDLEKLLEKKQPGFGPKPKT